MKADKYLYIFKTPDRRQNLVAFPIRNREARGRRSAARADLLHQELRLRDQELSIALHHFLREERKFENFAALKDQIAADAAQARTLLDSEANFLKPLSP